MKMAYNGISIIIVSLILVSCSYIEKKHEVAISNPDFVKIDGPLRFELGQSESRELRYQIVDDEKYDVIGFKANNCLVSDQGNGYFRVSEVHDKCAIEFNTIQKRFDIELLTIGNGITEFMTNSFAREHNEIVNVLAIGDYNTNRKSYTASGCEITSEEGSAILGLSNFKSDCILQIVYEPKKEMFKAIKISLVVSDDFSRSYVHHEIALSLFNHWADILIHRVTVTGHLYGIRKDGTRRLIENVSTTFSSIPGGEIVKKLISYQKKGDGPSEIKKYELEVLSVSNCYFGMWETRNCLDIVKAIDSFAIGLDAEIILPDN